jgi:hypothetical protein
MKKNVTQWVDNNAFRCVTPCGLVEDDRRLSVAGLLLNLPVNSED